MGVMGVSKTHKGNSAIILKQTGMPELSESGIRGLE